MVKRVLLVNATPGGRLVASPGQERPQGYYQRFGVTATNEGEVRSIVEKYLMDDLGSTASEIEMAEPDFATRDADIWAHIGNSEKLGIWYASGRAFYLEEECDEDSVDSDDDVVH